MIKASDMIGSKCVNTFVDRAGRFVLSFEKEVAIGSEPSWRLSVQRIEVRVVPENLIQLGEAEEPGTGE